jgi:hypothetical protein
MCHEFTFFPHIDSDTAYSTYPLISKSDRDSTKDESSSTIKASDDQIAPSSTNSKYNSSGSGTASKST